MPRLKQITCQVEWPETGLKFEEYGIVYGDGLVETFIAVPEKPQPFSMHLTSQGYIAEGLAMLIYIDGEYQCNRNRLHLKPPKKGQSRNQTEVDIRVRQKEKTIGGGTFIGRAWRFDCHNIVPNGQFPGDFDPSHFDQLGVIEVIVLRCRAKSEDDSGSDSLTHESILGEIDHFGQAREAAGTADEGANNHQATAEDAPEEAEDLSGLAALPGMFDGAADEVPHHFGLDGEAPPPGYWPYHGQPPPGNEYRMGNRPERRVHFDHGSPRPSYYPTRASSQPNYIAQPPSGYRAGPTPTNNIPPGWHRRDADDYGAHSAWRGPQQAPTYEEKGSSGWSWGQPNQAPQEYGEPGPSEYSDYPGHQPQIPPSKPPEPHQPVWMAPGYAGPSHSGWPPIPSTGYYPVWTPQPQFGPGPNFPTTSGGYPSCYQSPHGVQGPGYMMNYPIPAGGWPQNLAGTSGSLDPAKEQNNQGNDSGSQAQGNSWGNNHGGNNNKNNSWDKNAAANDTTTGGWGQGGGDVSNTNNANDNVQNHGGDQQSGMDNANTNTGWGDPQPSNNEAQGNWDGNQASRNTESQGNWDGNQASQNTETQGNWDNSNNNANNAQNNNATQGNWDSNTNNAQNNIQTQGNWENNTSHAQNNGQTQGNWDNNTNQAQDNGQTQGDWANNNTNWAANNANPINNANQPQQTQNQWNNNNPSQPLPDSTAPTSLGLRSARPLLYGPYGAYYRTTSTSEPPHHHGSSHGLSPPAVEAEEEQPPFDVPETIAAEKHTTHQVQPGKGYLYCHKRASPEYLDGIEEPYARFVFKYRTKEQIERELGITIECEPTGDEEKRKFTDKTPDELIELLIRAQNALGGKIPSPPPQAVPAAAGGEEKSANHDNSFNPAPVPAPTAYKYLKYELPKGRNNPGLGISNGANTNAPIFLQTQQQPPQQQQTAQAGGGGDWQISSSGPAEGWGAPPAQTAPGWQTAAESGNQNQNQTQTWGGGGTSGNHNAGGASSRHSSSSGDAGSGWGSAPNPNPAPAPAQNGSEAPLPAGSSW